MRKLRTLEALDDALASDFAWRRKELTDIRAAIGKAKTSAQRMHLRAGIALLYAHWEGYVKFASESYVSFVAYQRLKLQELSPSFLCIALGKSINDAASASRPRYHLAIVTKLKDGLFEKARLSPTHLPGMKSNLNWERFTDILDALGLSYERYEAAENMINKNLLGARNSIAHGNEENVQLDVFEPTYRKVIEILESLRDQVSNAAARKLYMLPTSQIRQQQSVHLDSSGHY